jgi:hypothetical protein
MLGYGTRDALGAGFSTFAEENRGMILSFHLLSGV